MNVYYTYSKSYTPSELIVINKSVIYQSDKTSSFNSTKFVEFFVLNIFILKALNVVSKQLWWITYKNINN